MTTLAQLHAALDFVEEARAAVAAIREPSISDALGRTQALLSETQTALRNVLAARRRTNDDK